MERAIGVPNDELKERAPRCEIVRFEADRKKDLVGYQGQVRFAVFAVVAVTGAVTARLLERVRFCHCGCGFLRLVTTAASYGLRLVSVPVSVSVPG